MEGRGEVCVGGRVGYTLSYPTEFMWAIKTDQEMKCGGGGVGVNIGWGTLPWGDRSEHWVVTLPYGTSVFPRDFFRGPMPPASVKWGTSENLRGQNISAATKIAFDFKSCMNTPFLKCFFNSSFPRALFCVYNNLVV